MDSRPSRTPVVWPSQAISLHASAVHSLWEHERPLATFRLALWFGVLAGLGEWAACGPHNSSSIHIRRHRRYLDGAVHRRDPVSCDRRCTDCPSCSVPTPHSATTGADIRGTGDVHRSAHVRAAIPTRGRGPRPRCRTVVFRATRRRAAGFDKVVRRTLPAMIVVVLLAGGAMHMLRVAEERLIGSSVGQARTDAPISCSSSWTPSAHRISALMATRARPARRLSAGCRTESGSRKRWRRRRGPYPHMRRCLPDGFPTSF